MLLSIYKGWTSTLTIFIIFPRKQLPIGQKVTFVIQQPHGFQKRVQKKLHRHIKVCFSSSTTFFPFHHTNLIVSKGSPEISKKRFCKRMSKRAKKPFFSFAVWWTIFEPLNWRYLFFPTVFFNPFDLADKKRSFKINHILIHPHFHFSQNLLPHKFIKINKCKFEKRNHNLKIYV